jgi:serine/threonine protein kinase
MSPEQAAGKPLDVRSDIFSFGCVLYELLTGRKAFAGVSNLEVLQTILHGSPQPLSDAVPLELRMVVEKALEKEPGDRYQGMRDLVVDLRRWLRKPVPSMAPAKGGQRKWWWAGAVSASVAAILWLSNRPDYPGPQSLLVDAKFTRLTNFDGVETEAAISPDGRFIAFLSDRSGAFDIWLTQVGSAVFANLTKGAHADRSSP